MRPIKLNVNADTQKYSIIIGSNLISNLETLIKKSSIKFNKYLLLIDRKVPKKEIYKLKKSFKNKNCFIFFIKATERNKSQKTINDILNVLLKNNFSSQDCLISIGGGITGDIGGFAASLFKRGMQFINVPTTLLSQVDSSIGGKTGINSNYGKNLIGSFYQPDIVIADTETLKTLPSREIVCGYAEILKSSLIDSNKNFNFLDKNLNKILKLKKPYLKKAIINSCMLKKRIVEKDEKEKKFRKVLNLGHTFAHAYEATLGFSKKLNHGEAVILGIISALKFSFYIRLIRLKDYEPIFDHVVNNRLPSDIKKYFSYKDLKKVLVFMSKDKKIFQKK